MWILKLALRRPYIFVVRALLILLLGVAAINTTPTDMVPIALGGGEENAPLGGAAIGALLLATGATLFFRSCSRSCAITCDSPRLTTIQILST